jgi:hypothetical protein
VTGQFGRTVKRAQRAVLNKLSKEIVALSPQMYHFARCFDDELEGNQTELVE